MAKKFSDYSQSERISLSDRATEPLYPIPDESETGNSVLKTSREGERV
jgi:hypothetical protein